jgi:hypothetical protein
MIGGDEINQDDLVISKLLGQNIEKYSIYGIVLFPIAVGLFLLGHKKEGNLRTMTIIVIMKYLKSKLALIIPRRKQQHI